MALSKSVFVAMIGLSCLMAAAAEESTTDGSIAEDYELSSMDSSQQLGPQASGVPFDVYPTPYPYIPQVGPYAGPFVPPPYSPYGCIYKGCVYPYPYPYGPDPYIRVSETKTVDKGMPTKQNVISSTHYASALNGQFLNNLDLEIGK